MTSKVEIHVHLHPTRQTQSESTMWVNLGHRFQQYQVPDPSLEVQGSTAPKMAVNLNTAFVYPYIIATYNLNIDGKIAVGIEI